MAESGPARVAALPAVTHRSPLATSASTVKLRPGLGFSEGDQGRQTRSFSGGWPCAKFSGVELGLPSIQECQLGRGGLRCCRCRLLLEELRHHGLGCKLGLSHGLDVRVAILVVIVRTTSGMKRNR